MPYRAGVGRGWCRGWGPWRRRTAVAILVCGAVALAGCGEDLQVVGTDGAQGAGPGSTVAGAAVDAQDAAASTTTTTTVVEATTSTGPPPTAAPATAPTTTPDTGPYVGVAAESLAFVNEHRAEQGLPALEVDPELTAMATGWANQIASDGDLRHNPQLGEQAPDQYMSVGENVGYAPSAGAIDNGWWESDGHRENILRPSFDAIGIAFVVDQNGTTWGVQVFAGS